MPSLIKKIGPQTTTNAYVTTGVVHLPPSFNRYIVHIKERNTEAIKWKILGSLDNVYWSEVEAEASVVKNGTDFDIITDPWLYLDIQVTDDAGGTHGSVSIAIAGAPT